MRDHQRINRLLKQIIKAFSDVVYPGDNNLVTGSELLEPDCPASFYRGKHWQELSGEKIQSSYDAIAFLTPAAFHFYFPAFLIASLKTGDEVRNKDGEMVGDMVDGMLLTLLDPRPWKNDNPLTGATAEDNIDPAYESGYRRMHAEIIKKFTIEQRVVTKLYLESLRDEDNYDADERIMRVLEQFSN